MKNWFEKHDIFTKLLSVLAAIVLWGYFMGIQNPTRTLEYKNIAVQLSGVDELYNSYNLKIISGADETVDVRVSGSSSRLATLTASQIKVRADVSESITTPGTYEIAYHVILPESGMTCVGRSPETISVTVDRVETKTVPVSVNLSDDAADGYVFEEPTLSVKSVEISGPETELDKVTSAVIDIDTSNLKDTLTDNYTYSLVDEDGDAVDTTNISRSVASVSVTIPIKQVKSVPLEVTISPEDAEADISTAISPKSVEIIGDPSTVSGIDSIVLGAVNANTAEDGDTFDFDISVPTGVKLNDGQPTTATVTVSVASDVRETFDITDISLNDINKDETAEVTLETDSLQVTLSGTRKQLDGVDASDISAVAEIASADLSDGQHTIGATIRSPDNTTVIGTYSVTVRITRPSE